MTFAEFKSIVLENLGPDAERTGEGIESFRNRSITNAMIDLQRFIVELRQSNSLILQANQLVTEGAASSGVMPADMRPREWWIVAGGDGDSFAIISNTYPDAPYVGTYLPVIQEGVSTWWEKAGDPTYTVAWGADPSMFYLKAGSTVLYTMDAAAIEYPWDGVWTAAAGLEPVPSVFRLGGKERYQLDWYSHEKRFDLTSEQMPADRYYFTIGVNRRFTVHPAITAGVSYLEIIYEGYKRSWNDTDNLSEEWSEDVAEAVAEYAKWKIVHNYDKDSVSRAIRHRDTYLSLRRSIYLAFKV